MPGLLDWLGLGGTPAFAPNEMAYLQSQGALPAGGMLDPRAIRQQAAWGALTELGGRLAEAGARRPVTQPGPGVGAAFVGANQAYQRGLQGAAANAGLEQQAQQQQSYQGLLAGMNPSMRALYSSMGPERGAAAMIAAQQRDQQGFSLSPGQTRFDAQGRPIAALPQQYAPQVTRDGYIWDPNEYMRSRQQGGTLADRNNNPGNLRPPGQSTGFQRFDTPEAGVAAMVRQLDLYRDRNNLNTVQGIISRWAPPNENDTAAYVRSVAGALGVAPDAPIDTRDEQTMRRLVVAMARQEGGRPLAPDTLDRGFQLARNQAQMAPQQQALPPGIVGQVPQRQAEDNAVVQVMTPDGPRWMRRSDAVGQPAVPGQGLSVTVPGPNGPVMVQSGPGASTARPGNMAQPTLNNIEEQIVNNTARLQRVRDVASAFRPEFLQMGPQIRNWAASLQERMGMALTPEQRQRLEAFTEFRSRAYTELTQTLREMSGAAVTEGEAQRLLAAIGDPSRDSPTEFQAKMNNVIRTVSLANARMHYYRRNGIQGALDSTPLSDMQGIINRRGDEVAAQLRGQNVPAEEIQRRVRATLAVEFGFSP